MESTENRAALIARLTREVGRDLATKTVLFHAALAGRLGMTATALKSLDLLREADPPLTARDLADRTGLTPGAITGVVDRLEERGFLERVRDPSDRRRWELRPIADRREQVIDLFEPLRDSIAHICADFSDADLATVERFLARLGGAMDDAAAELRANG